MKTWECEFCGKTEDSRFVAPQGWLSLREPGNVLVCSMDCAADVITAIKAEEARQWSTSS